MPTKRQTTGERGELFVAKTQPCPTCKRSKTLKKLPPNFKCADLICDFCGGVSQVKTFSKETAGLPGQILGAAWGPQKARMMAGIYTSLWFVRVNATDKPQEVYFLSSENQLPDMFVPRAPLGVAARRAGWQGFFIKLAGFEGRVVNVYSESSGSTDDSIIS